MPVSQWWRRTRRRWGWREPAVTARGTRRGPLLIAIAGGAALVVAIFWWALDPAPLFGGATRKELTDRAEALAADLARAREEVSSLRTHASELETELAMTRGTQEALSRQVSDLTGENAQLKEDVAFLQRLFAEGGSPGSVTIPRLTLERVDDDSWRYGLLVVRGAAPGPDYRGSVVLQATLVSTDPAQAGTRAITLPEDQPEAARNLALKFKYYQRIEGTLRVPAGSRVTALTARVYEDGNTTPRATRTLSNP